MINKTCKNNPKFYGRIKGRKLSPFKELLFNNVLPFIKYDKNIWKEQNEKYLEIGFGHGEHLIYQSNQNPNTILIGAEVFQNGIVDLIAKTINRENLLKEYKKNKKIFDNKDYIESIIKHKNIFIYPDDVRKIYKDIPDSSISKIFILYPDPWPKKRHYKRRIISKENITVFKRILKQGGLLRFVSDVQDYNEWTLEEMKNTDFKLIRNEQTPPEDWVITKYEGKAKKEGRNSKYLDYICKK